MVVSLRDESDMRKWPNKESSRGSSGFSEREGGRAGPAGTMFTRLGLLKPFSNSIKKGGGVFKMYYQHKQTVRRTFEKVRSL